MARAPHRRSAQGAGGVRVGCVTEADRPLAYVALGANEGDVIRTLVAARAALERLGLVVARSGLHLTDPVGGPPEQPPYRNAVVAWRPAPAWATRSRALAALLAIERALGRTRRERWGPRTIDLDLLDFVAPDPPDAFAFALPAPDLPHPRAHERAFVLVPWAEIAPDHPLAPGGVPVAAALGRLDRRGVRSAPRREAASWEGAG